MISRSPHFPSFSFPFAQIGVGALAVFLFTIHPLLDLTTIVPTMKTIAFLSLAAALLPSIAAKGYVSSITIDGTEYKGPSVGDDSGERLFPASMSPIALILLPDPPSALPPFLRHAERDHAN